MKILYIFTRKYVFINDFNVHQKVSEKQGQICPWPKEIRMTSFRSHYWTVMYTAKATGPLSQIPSYDPSQHTPLDPSADTHTKPAGDNCTSSLFSVFSSTSLICKRFTTSDSSPKLLYLFIVCCVCVK